MLGSGTTNEVQYLMWTCHTLALNQSSIAAHDTLKVFFKVLSWSLHWLYLGRWPTHDWNGVEYQEGTKDFTLAYDVYWLAEGYAAVLFSNNCDLDFIHKTWRLENCNNQETPCTWCRASLSPEANWRDFKERAPWTSTIYSATDWLAAHPNHVTFFDLLFIGIWSLSPDWMHCKYLGLDQYFFGSVLKMLVFTIMGGEPFDNMREIWTELREYFKEHKVPNCYRLITINMFNNQDFPRLKGRAAELRHLGEALLHVFDMYMNTGDELHKYVKTTLKMNIKLEEMLDDHEGWNFQGADYTKLIKLAHGFLIGYNACQASAKRRELLLFNVTIKSHMLLHCVYRSNLIHPKYVWCFGGEAFMKIMKKLHSSCTDGNAPHTATVKSADKWLFAMHCQYTGVAKARL